MRVNFAVATPLTDTRRSVPVESDRVPAAGAGVDAGGEVAGAGVVRVADVDRSP